jgi:two-component system, OmpR family, sensor kinase
MKIFKSIKWRLQLWYGLILVAVLAGFGFTAFQLERERVFRDIFGELSSRANALMVVLHPPRGRPGEQPFGSPPPPRDSFPDEPNDRPPEQFGSPPKQFHLPAQVANLFDPSDPNRFYFIITLPDGRELARSTNAPEVKTMWDNRPPANDNPVPRLTADQFHPVAFQTLGKFEEMIRTLPSGEFIQVGCLVAPELKEIRLVALRLTAVGGLILLLGLAGGWWFVNRAIKPIENISAAAVKISGGDLSQRINVAETESELGKLAAVLNSTFARLDAAFTQQKQFASDAAHELRTPVSVILTQTQTALNRERQAAEYRETLEACQRGAQRMRRLIESLLELARLDAGQEQIKRRKFDLSQIARDCVELVQPLAEETGVKMVSEFAPVEIAADSERLAQVIANLLTNAVQYNHDGGEVKIATRLENGLAVLTVSDTGVGIPAEDLPRVFERFYRADKSRSSAHAGLGLAICRAIVSAHGGTIDVSSGTDAGTTFTVRLPVA